MSGFDFQRHLQYFSVKLKFNQLKNRKKILVTFNQICHHDLELLANLNMKYRQNYSFSSCHLQNLIVENSSVKFFLVDLHREEK